MTLGAETGVVCVETKTCQSTRWLKETERNSVSLWHRYKLPERTEGGRLSRLTFRGLSSWLTSFIAVRHKARHKHCRGIMRLRKGIHIMSSTKQRKGKDILFRSCPWWHISSHEALLSPLIWTYSFQNCVGFSTTLS